MLTFSLKFDAIGTSWEIDTPAPLAEVTKAHLLELVERFDSIYSRFRHESIVMRIANAADGGTFSFPVDAIPKFDLYAVTDGAVDPLVGRDLELLGYDSDYTLVPDDVATTLMAAQRPVWHRDVPREGHAITTRRPLVIDTRTIPRGDPERRVLAGLRDRMMAPEAAAEAMHAYAEETNRLNRERRSKADLWKTELTKWKSRSLRRSMQSLTACITPP
ncbi:FAD:protein FMN transferase [Agrobacterium tumefaciens]|uniref:FAD:protein FMN transferase n=1 Tax=Agrobacterium tumefaciens TaxID=358 RepID=UPI001AEE9F37|nr:FAD:protein FMN transferase [Agrobacterium tumefaciens]